jgi:hypothetical protein
MSLCVCFVIERLVSLSFYLCESKTFYIAQLSQPRILKFQYKTDKFVGLICICGGGITTATGSGTVIREFHEIGLLCLNYLLLAFVFPILKCFV